MPAEKLLPIGLGDLIRVLSALDLDDEQAQAVGKLLGIESSQPDASGTGDELGAGREPDAPRPRPRPRPPSPSSTDSSSASEGAPGSGAALAGLTLERLPPVPPLAPSWLSTQVLPMRASLSQRKPLDALLPPRTTRGLLSAMLATRVRSDDLDLEQLLDAFVKRRVVSELPRQELPSLRRGVQILVDRSDALLPFFEDATGLVQRVLDLVSSDATQVLYFRGDPRSCYLGSATKPQPFTAPAAATPVLAITDLGARNAAQVTAWRELALELRKRQSPLIALVPYPRSRWPRGLERSLTILPWDRRTTLRTLRRQRAERSR
ncbi:MAG: hypothetical protein WDO69_31100 [Pseudomonadota bacterium]